MRTLLVSVSMFAMLALIMTSGAQDPTRVQELKGIFNKAVDASKRGDKKESARLFKEAATLAPKVFGADHPNTGAIIYSAASAHLGASLNREAEPLYREALRIRELHLAKDHLTVATTLQGLGTTLDRLGKYEESEKVLLRCLAIRERQLPKNDPNLALTLNNLGSACQALAHYEAAEGYFKRAQAIYEANLGPEHPEVAGIMHNISDVYSNMGMYKQAEELARRSLAIHEAKLGKDHIQVALNLNELGLICAHAERNSEAEAFHRRALQIQETHRGKNHPETATTLNNLALALIGLGRDADAELLLRRSLAIREASVGEAHSATAHVLTNLGQLVSRLGRRAEASKHLTRALAIYEKALGKDHPRLPPVLSGLATLRKEQGDFKAAETLLLRAVAIGEKHFGTRSIQIADSLNNLAAVYVHSERFGEAEKLLARCQEIREAQHGKDHPNVVAAYVNLGNLHWRRSDFAKATDFYQRALKIAEANPTGLPAEFRGNVLRLLANVQQAQGQTDAALKWFDQSLDIDFALLHGVLAHSSESAMHDFMTTRDGVLPTLISLAAAAGDDAAAERALTWTLRLKGAVFDALCRYRVAQQLLPSDERMARWRAQKAFLANVAVNPPAGISGERLKRLVDEAQNEVAELEAELNRTLAQKSPDLLAQRDAVTIERVRKQLPKDGVLVEFVRAPGRDFKKPAWLDDRYYAFVLPREGPPRMIDLGLAKPIDAGVEEIRKEFLDFQDKLRDCDSVEEAKALEKTAEAQFVKKNAALYARLLAPLEKTLGDARLLVLSPDGALNRLPFEALVDERGKYLIERYRCVYVSSGRDLLRAPAPSAQGIVVFAAPDYKLAAAERVAQAEKVLAKKPLAVATRGELRSAGWKPLAGAKAEAGDIAQIFKDGKQGPFKTFVGSEALEEVLKAMKPPRILHLATHGFFLDKEPSAPDEGDANAGAGAARNRLKRADNPLLRSGIVLAGANTVGDTDDPSRAEDGWVTAEEIALLDLHGTELVVLSACQTGLGDIKTGEGVFGLRRAFLHAGARTLVTSLFEVPDAETRVLMQRFYRGIAKGDGKLESLHAARRGMLMERRQSHGAAHPFFWASFVLVGQPD